MAVVNLYNGIYKVLANDSNVLNYLGIGSTATPLQKAQRIQKRSKPTKLVENLPLIAFYAPPGRRDVNNYQVYNTQFVFDIYTSDNVDLAQRLGDRILQLFDGVINPMMGVENFESLMVTQHESECDLANTYCWTVVIQFSITIGE